MNKHVQIKNVDESLHRKLKIRAIESGLSVSDYLKREIASLVNRPTNADILRNLQELPPINSDLNSVAYVREDRDSH